MRSTVVCWRVRKRTYLHKTVHTSHERLQIYQNSVGRNNRYTHPGAATPMQRMTGMMVTARVADSGGSGALAPGGVWGRAPAGCGAEPREENLQFRTVHVHSKVEREHTRRTTSLTRRRRSKVNNYGTAPRLCFRAPWWTRHSYALAACAEIVFPCPYMPTTRKLTFCCMRCA